MRGRRDPEGTRDAIFRAAETVFADFGYFGAASSQIAKEAGVTKSLIHHHYGSKSKLWGMVKDQASADYHTLAHDVFPDDWRDREHLVTTLRRGIERLFQHLRDNPRVVRFLTWHSLERADAPVEIRKLGQHAIGSLRRAQEQGIVRKDVDALHILTTLFAIVEHWFQSKPLNEERLEEQFSTASADDAYLEDTLEIFLRGILA